MQFTMTTIDCEFPKVSFSGGDLIGGCRPTLVNKVKKGVMSCLFLTPAQGSVTSVYAATADVPSEETMYLSPYPVNTFTYFDWWGPFVGPTVCKAASKVYDKNKRSYLWEYSMQLCQKYM